MAVHNIMVILFLTVTVTVSVESFALQLKYVQPTSNDTSGSVTCTSESCTFDQFVYNLEQQFLSNTIFIFLAGDHQLSINLSLHGVQNVTFQGISVEGPVIIRLDRQVGLSFDNCDNIEMNSLNFNLSGEFEHGLKFSETNNVKLHNITIGMENENITGYTSAVLSQASVINIADSNFVGINGQFGAALLACDLSEITFMGTNNFINNWAKLGGAIHSISSTLLFYDISSFINNTAMISNGCRNDACMVYRNGKFDSGVGGAVYATNSQIIMKGCANFTTNKATILGGAVAAVNMSSVIIDGSTCTNKALSSVGIVFDDNSITQHLYINESGGAIHINCSEVTIGNVTFRNNFSPVHGGGAHFIQSNITLYNVTATNNTANEMYGGAIRFFNCTKVHMNGENTFISNYAKQYAGAVEFCDVQFVNIAGVNYFEGNSADNGGAIDFIYRSEAVVISGNIVFKNNAATKFGGAIYVYTTVLNFTAHMEYRGNTAEENNGGAIHITSSDGTEFHGDISFIDNVAGRNGGAFSIDTNSQVSFHGYTVFKKNHAEINGGAISCNMNSKINFFGNIVFQTNSANGYGGAIYNLNSRIIFYNNNSVSTDSEFQFESNYADYGGAIAMTGTTKLIINPQVEIIFTENKAQYAGGAFFVDIYTSSVCLTETDNTKIDCFIMLNTCYHSFNASQFLLHFTNNNAEMSGNVLYGGSLKECRGLFKSITDCGVFANDQKETAYEIVVNSISSGITPESNSTTFSSKPTKLCFYNENSINNSYCGSPAPIMNIFPGQTFNKTLQIIDQYDNPVDGVVVRSTQDVTGDYQINHTIIITQSSYQNFTFQVLVYNEDLVNNNSQLNFALYLESTCRDMTYFDISLQSCPFGFEFSGTNGKCQCLYVLQKFTQDCNIDEATIGRYRNNFWLSFTTDYILLYDGGCPLDYCKDALVYVPLDDSDVQCNNNRRGNLCGECIENYSLALGSLSCTQNCTTFHPFLILIFGALGILLILLLFLLHLTVAAGTINGLLFYANIVQANYQIFLDTNTSNPFIIFSRAFIGWLNLDFGISICLYKGMDIYAYSWLQFLFPAYLWILMLIIIVSAHFSRRISKSFGQNPVAVLATVLLISYGKLLKAIIVPLPWAMLQNITQNDPIHSEYVWLFNGNMPYFGFKHITLVVFAGLVLLFLFLPYSFLLLCGHWLQAKSHWRVLSWINKLKPFMDAYYAPFRKNERYWIGLVLLTRCSLILIIAFTASRLLDQNLNLVIVSSVTAGLSFFKGRVYEKWYNDFLESSFLLNLCVLSIATLYVQSEKSFNPNVNNTTSTVSTISVLIAFLFFIGIIVFHTYKRLKKLQPIQCVHKHYHLKRQHDEITNSEQDMEVISNTSVRLQELLLDDNS